MSIHSKRSVRSMVVTLFVGICISFFGVVVLASTEASAHDSVSESSPQNGSQLDEFPERVEITFSGIPNGDYNTFAVTRSDTKDVIFTGKPHQDGQKLWLDTPQGVNPGNGEYTLGFRITSSDGHATQGKIVFEVGAQDSQGGASVSSESQASDTSSGWMKWAVAGAGVLVLLGVLVILIRILAESRKND